MCTHIARIGGVDCLKLIVTIETVIPSLYILGLLSPTLAVKISQILGIRLGVHTLRVSS